MSCVSILLSASLGAWETLSKSLKFYETSRYSNYLDSMMSYSVIVTGFKHKKCYEIVRHVQHFIANNEYAHHTHLFGANNVGIVKQTSTLLVIGFFYFFSLFFNFDETFRGDY